MPAMNDDAMTHMPVKRVGCFCRAPPPTEALLDVRGETSVVERP